MKTIKDYAAEGVSYVINSMGERITTRDGSIIFPNGWVASIVRPESDLSKYSVAICDYDGYFNWNILRNVYGGDGTVICNTEEEVCDVLAYIQHLQV